MSTYLIINEQHSLFDEQRELLRSYGKVKFINIPSAGLTRDEMARFEIDHCLDTGDTVIFATPVSAPYLLKRLSRERDTFVSANGKSFDERFMYDVKVFYKSTSTTGWQII